MSTRNEPRRERRLYKGGTLARALVLLNDGVGRTATEVPEQLSADLLSVRSELSRAAGWGWFHKEGDNGNEASGPLRTYRLALSASEVQELLFGPKPAPGRPRAPPEPQYLWWVRDTAEEGTAVVAAPDWKSAWLAALPLLGLDAGTPEATFDEASYEIMPVTADDVVMLQNTIAELRGEETCTSERR